MKLRIDFITNSSSTAYIIVNNSDEEKTLVDFVMENPQLVEQFNKTYGHGFTQITLLESAARDFNESFEPGERKYCIFGDEDDTLIGHVFDYILRDGGMSESFSWHFSESLR